MPGLTKAVGEHAGGGRVSEIGRLGTGYDGRPRLVGRAGGCADVQASAERQALSAAQLSLGVLRGPGTVTAAVATGHCDHCATATLRNGEPPGEGRTVNRVSPTIEEDFAGRRALWGQRAVAAGTGLSRGGSRTTKKLGAN